ncbi:GNAT family N-acetyltransferase [Streptomyces sp. NPDC088196]|uniref:GNAT family N-acetyltransferase n=1 Tax=Streptomyces sp. NPDC088196 TaxID=3154868 RepID=UPI0034503F9C
MLDISLTRLSPQAVREDIDEFSELYASDFVDPPLKGTDFYSRERFKGRLSGDYLNAPRFEAVAARNSDGLAGFIYGCSLPAGTSWWSDLVGQLPETLTTETGERTVAIIDFVVAKRFRGVGIGSRLYQEFIDGRSEERASLFCSPPQQPAYSIWRHWGYEKVGESRPAEDANLLHAFLKNLKAVS